MRLIRQLMKITKEIEKSYQKQRKIQSKIPKRRKRRKRFICLRCDYKWESRKKFGEPFQCPKCGWRKIIKFGVKNGRKKT